MALQITPQLTQEEQAVFDIISEIVIPLCANLKGIIAWNYSVNLLKVLVIAESIDRRSLVKRLPRPASIGNSSITTACTSLEIEVVIHRFLKEVYESDR